jgi:hypothetical protein
MGPRLLLTLLTIVNLTAIGAIVLYSKLSEQPTPYSTIKPQTGPVRCIPTGKTAALHRLQELFTASEHIKHAPMSNAMNLYTKTLQGMPQISTILARLCTSYAKSAKYDDAISTYKASLTLNPSSTYTFILPDNSFKKTKPMQALLRTCTTTVCHAKCRPTTNRAITSFNMKKYYI